MYIYMYELENMLLQMQEHLEKVVTQAKADLNTTVPEGHLRISIDKNKPRYYQCIDDNKGVYIPRDNKELPKRLAQKGYNKAVVKKGEARLKQIKRITKNYSDDEIEKIYTSMNKARQLLVTPIEPTWDQLLTKWYEEEYQGKEFKEGTPLILTEKGERVRSKSEKILADYFKLKKDEHDWKIHTIPEGRKVPFKVMGQIAREDVEQVLNFALDMSYGDGHHRDHRQGGRHRRSNNEIFANTFQGKIAEYVVYYCLRQYGFEVEEPDLGVFGENIWDNVDIDCNGRHISIKSTKERGQLLLLEKGDWNDQGCYIPNINDGGKMAQYDYHMLVRVRPSCEDILRNNRILYGSELPEEVIDILLNQSWEYCMPRYISRDELIYLIQNNFVIKAGSYFNKTKMDADNYYVKAYDMHELPEIINGLS